MITLKQIQVLAEKVDKAVGLISLLKEENRALKNTLEKSQKRIREFENLINAFKNDQSEIEQTVLRAIEKLDNLEEEVTEGAASPAARKDGSAGKDQEPVQGGREEEEPDEGDEEEEPDEEEPQSQSSDSEEDETKPEDERELDIF